VKCSKNSFILSYFVQTTLKMNEILLWSSSCSNIKNCFDGNFIIKTTFTLTGNWKDFHCNKIGFVFVPCFTTELIKDPFCLYIVLYFPRTFLLHNLKWIFNNILKMSTPVLNVSPWIVKRNQHFSNCKTKCLKLLYTESVLRFTFIINQPPSEHCTFLMELCPQYVSPVI
jgi:hypothetical protein